MKVVERNGRRMRRRRRMVSPTAAPAKAQRLKREEYPRTKHDSIFSKWQVLVGPYDWENYTSQKDGTERYRIHNLPISSSPGIYELGVAAANTDKGRTIRKLDAERIIVVYVGQADNVRTRLQHYGRAGSHLDHGTSITVLDKTDALQRGPGLFKEIFARGFSIVFRWAPMKSKREAENAEGLLLGVFDYAWNRVANGSCRREDVLLKLESITSVSNPFASILKKLQFFKVHAFNRKRVGIKIEAGEPPERVIGCPDHTGGNCKERDDSISRICGIIMTDGSICRKKPVSGRKRCVDHKGMRIKTSKSMSTSQAGHFSDGMNGNALELEGNRNNLQILTICGVTLEDGSICMEIPPKDRKRCPVHKGRRIIKTQPT